MISLKNSGIVHTINQIIFNARMQYGIVSTITKLQFLNWIDSIRNELLAIVRTLDELALSLQTS